MRQFFRSFRYAARGLRYCFRERNFRCHAGVLCYMVWYLTAYDWFVLRRGEWAVLLLAAAAVLAAEAMNTALEALVDLASPGRHPLAAKAKDIAAGAVLLTAMGAVAVGIAVLYQPQAFRLMFAHYRAHPLALLALGISLILTGFIILWPKKKETGDQFK